MTEKPNRADISPAEIADRIQKRIAEAIDRELYYPLKTEFERTSHTSRLGFLKEQLKDRVEQIIEQELSSRQASNTQAPEIPASVVSGRPTRYRLLLEITESISDPLVITEMFVPNTRMFIHDSRMHGHEARIVDIGIMD